MTLIDKAENRTIDYIPRSELHGRLVDQSTIWFAGSGEVLSFTIGPSLACSLIGMSVGMALSTGGVRPCQPGVAPRAAAMVPPRPQFGRYGALWFEPRPSCSTGDSPSPAPTSSTSPPCRSSGSIPTGVAQWRDGGARAPGCGRGDPSHLDAHQPPARTGAGRPRPDNGDVSGAMGWTRRRRRSR